jgi:uncharacterized protein YciI
MLKSQSDFLWGRLDRLSLNRVAPSPQHGWGIGQGVQRVFRVVRQIAMPRPYGHRSTSRVGSVTFCLTWLLATPAVPQTQPKLDMQVRQLVFLVNVANPPTLTDSQQAVIQQAHLTRLEALYTARTALVVGPLVDAGAIRGVVLLDVGSMDEAREIMRDDPWIRAGQLTAEIHPIFVARNVPQRGPRFMDLEALWFGLLTRLADAPSLSRAELERVQAGHMSNINAMAAAGKLLLAGPFEEDIAMRGILIFRATNRDEITELMTHDPAIQQHRMELKVYQLFLPKGTFPTSGGEMFNTVRGIHPTRLCRGCDVGQFTARSGETRR